MKINILNNLTVALAMLLGMGLYAQSSCSDYYPIEEGVRFELTSYDKKGKVESVQNTVVKSVSSSGATMHTEVKAADGSTTIDSEYDIECTDDGVKIDLSHMLSEQMTSSLAGSGSDAEVEVTGTAMETPNNLEVGQQLPDSRVDIDVKVGTMDMKFHVVTTDRKVEGKESVTTPAGTFDCVVISSKTDLKMMFTKHTTSKSWLAEGVGLVQEETYDKKGNVISSQKLTAFSK